VHSTIIAYLESMFFFLFQTLFALQGTTKRTGSCSSHLSEVYFPSPTFIIIKPHERNALFASPNLDDEIIDQSESLDWLQGRLGFNYEQSIELARRFPNVHTLSIDEQLKPTLDRLQRRIGLSNDKLGELVRRQPTILNFEETLRLDGKSLKKLVQTVPPIIDSSAEGNLECKLIWLQDRLSLDNESLNKLVQKNPSVLNFSVADNLEPKLSWLQERLSLENTSLSQIVQKFPSVLTYSTECNLKPKLLWLQERLSLDNASLSKLVKTLPAVLGYSIEKNLKPKLVWLGERLVLDDASLSLVIQRQPSLFGCEIYTNLEPTIKFYEDCVGSDATRTMIAKRPSLLGYSLEKRLKPRLAEAREAGIPIDTGTVQRMAKYTEDKWSNGLAFQKTKLLKHPQLDGQQSNLANVPAVLDVGLDCKNRAVTTFQDR
jgi:hypothetical protein